mmetsp:Transcript_9234/g.23714  ORF Transcript_9234/g.23714 Transcript_9234/m.23714 type:complete len:248 (-) Transcript_9234:234-977(-)
MSGSSVFSPSANSEATSCLHSASSTMRNPSKIDAYAVDIELSVWFDALSMSRVTSVQLLSPSLPSSSAASCDGQILDIRNSKCKKGSSFFFEALWILSALSFCREKALSFSARLISNPNTRLTMSERVLVPAPWASSFFFAVFAVSATMTARSLKSVCLPMRLHDSLLSCVKFKRRLSVECKHSHSNSVLHGYCASVSPSSKTGMGNFVSSTANGSGTAWIMWSTLAWLRNVPLASAFTVLCRIQRY